MATKHNTKVLAFYRFSEREETNLLNTVLTYTKPLYSTLHIRPIYAHYTEQYNKGILYQTLFSTWHSEHLLKIISILPSYVIIHMLILYIVLLLC